MKAKLFNLLIKNNQKGIAALPTLLVVGGIITAISISLTASIYFYINSTSGANLSLKALSAAKSGAYDGLMRVVRDKSIASVPYEYNLSVGNQSAAVVICRDSEDCGGSGKLKITSVGSAFTRRKQIEAIVSVDSITSLTKLESMLEVAL